MIEAMDKFKKFSRIKYLLNIKKILRRVQRRYLKFDLFLFKTCD
jgi:hypothetical protein